MASLSVVHVERLYGAEAERGDLLGPVAGKVMPMPGAKAQAMSANRGGGMHVDARKLAGPHSPVAPVAGKATFLPGAQSQAMAANRGGGVHIDARKLAAPRYKFKPSTNSMFEVDSAASLNLTFCQCALSSASIAATSERTFEVPVAQVEMRGRAGAARADLLGPLAGKHMPLPGSQSQATAASLGGRLHVDARNFAGPRSPVGPLAGKATFLQGAQSQAMSANQGGGIHFDTRRCAAPRFKLTPILNVMVDVDSAANFDLKMSERAIPQASPNVPAQRAFEVPVAQVEMRGRAQAARAELLGPLAEKDTRMPGAQSQAMNASLGGSLHIAARNFAGARSHVGPVAGKEALLPGAQSQAMAVSRGGGIHVDARKFAAPRFTLNRPQNVIVDRGIVTHDVPKWERAISQASTAAPSEHTASRASTPPPSPSERIPEVPVRAKCPAMSASPVGGLHIDARNFAAPRSLLGPLAGKDMPMPGAKSQAMSASLGGSLYIDARDFAGPRCPVGPVAGKIMLLPGAQSQAMAANCGGCMHVDARKFAAPRYKFNPPQDSMVEMDSPVCLDLTKWERTLSTASTASSENVSD